MASTRFSSPFGDLQLLRRPRRANEILQAWDAADHYLLEHLAEKPPTAGSRILVVNDRFGALALALTQGGYSCDSWSDSAVAHLSMQDNARRNDLPEVPALPSLDTPSGDYHTILFRVPKSHSLLRYQLERLRNLRDNGSELIGAAMIKHLDPGTIRLIQACAGETRPSLAKKKARLIHFIGRAEADTVSLDESELSLPKWQLTLNNRANVFSRDKLDRGSQLLLQALETLDLTGSPRIADLGCGNGLLGIVAQRRWPGAELQFFDESYLAVDSARGNLERNCPASLAGFHATDCMAGYEGRAFDLVLCNPPFHQDYELGDHIARQMFKDARAKLAPGGQLWVVGNRHLPYHLVLGRLFTRLEVVASDAKFVVHRARV